MRRHLISSVLVFFLAFPNLCFPWSGRVVGVSDGDTIRVMHSGRETKIRLFGIDCPERDQAFGNKARRFTANMVFRKVVEVQEVDKDSYGRTVGWVSVDGKSLNKELLRAGLAWWYRYYAENERELEKLESEARKNKIGLWSSPNPIPPWEFRRTENH
ncbi:MAG: thermonuclease family protein [Desulfomonilaceae bacterium]